MDRLNVEKEIKIHLGLKHPRVVELLDFFEEDGKAYLILEHISGGNLFKYMGRNRRLQKNFIKTIFSDVIDAINYLHNNEIILRDLKPENILLDSSNHAKSIYNIYLIKF